MVLIYSTVSQSIYKIIHRQVKLSVHIPNCEPSLALWEI